MADNQDVPGKVPTQSGVAVPFHYYDPETAYIPVVFWADMAGAEGMIRAVWRNETGAGACLQPDTNR